MKTTDEILLKSHSYVKGLDRSILGVFATDEWKLTRYDILQRCFDESKNENYSQSKRTKIYSFGRQYAMGNGDYEVIGEWMFWRQRDTGMPTMRTTPKPILERIRFLNKLAGNPEVHDYFAIGIMDLWTAKQYAADGIDPEMALRLEQ